LGEDHAFIARRAMGWTGAQKGDARNYAPGMVVEFHQNAKGFTKGDKAVVMEGENGALLQKQDGTRIALPVDKADRFEVYRTVEVALAAGDRIRITRNAVVKGAGPAKATRLNNGDILTVAGFTPRGDIRLENGKLLPSDFGHFSLGYVDTSYASQGKTVDRVFIATGNESLPAANQQQWYVSASRGKEMAKVYLESKEEARDAIARTGERLSAVELTGTKLRDSWRTRISQSIERNRVRQFLKNRAVAVAARWKDRGKQKELNYA
jgi:ATP-dependent exoDNAse (exonuclease V) alpha subunit